MRSPVRRTTVDHDSDWLCPSRRRLPAEGAETGAGRMCHGQGTTVPNRPERKSYRCGLGYVRVYGQIIGVVAGLLLAVLGVGDALAATITVNTATDDNETNASLCSLREAIKAANTNAAVDGC